MVELLGYGIGTLILFVALIYGVVQYGRRNRANEKVTDAATVELYRHPDRYEAHTHDELEKKLQP